MYQSTNFTPRKWYQPHHCRDFFKYDPPIESYANEAEIIELVYANQYAIIFEKLTKSDRPCRIIKSLDVQIDKTIEYFVSKSNIKMIEYIINEPSFQSIRSLSYTLFDMIVKNDRFDILSLLMNTGQYIIDNLNAIVRHDKPKFIGNFNITDELISAMLNQNKINCLTYCIDEGLTDRIESVLSIALEENYGGMICLGMDAIKLLASHLDLAEYIDKLLVCASRNMDLACVKLCLELGGADPVALEISTDLDCTRALIEAGIVADLIDPEPTFGYFPHGIMSSDAAECKFVLESLKLKIGVGLRINKEYMLKVFCTICAKSYKNFLTIELFNYFLDYGLDPNILFSPIIIQYMISNQCLDLIQYIIDNHYSKIETQLDSMLLCATANGLINLVYNLVEHGANPLGEKPVLTAIAFGHYDLVVFYLKLGSDLGSLSIDPIAMLVNGFVIDNGQCQMFNKLKENSGSFHVGSYTFGSDHMKIFELLKEHQIVPTDPIIFELVNSQCGEILLYCMNHGMDINLCTDEGFLPLAKFVESKNYDMIQVLLDMGADVSVGNFYSIFVAIKLKDFRALELLFRYVTYIESSLIKQFLSKSEVINAYYQAHPVVVENDSGLVFKPYYSDDKLEVSDVSCVADEFVESETTTEFYLLRKQLIDFLIGTGYYF